MGCGALSGSRQKALKVSSIVPTDPGPTSSSSSSASSPLLLDPGDASDADAQPPEEDLGNSDEDEGIDDSSGSEPGLPPELMWAKQVRRQERQAKRRKRALRQAKRATKDEAPISATSLLDAKYRIGERLGRGTYASVSRCKHIASEADYALKTIDKRTASGEEQIREEIEIMTMVKHPKVVDFCECFEDSKYAYIVMELCSGGQLFDHVVTYAGVGWEEAISARAAAQIAHAVSYLHSFKVAHRDLKPENVMLTGEGDDVSVATLKVIDFSLSRRFTPGRFMTTMACTAHYVAPEVLTRRYTASCDIWSFGVIIYVLLSGTQPFCGNSEAEVLARVESGKYDFTAKPWGAKTAASKDLVRNMLLFDDSARLTADQVLQHQWLREESDRELLA